MMNDGHFVPVEQFRGNFEIAGIKNYTESMSCTNIDPQTGRRYTEHYLRPYLETHGLGNQT